MKRFILFVGMFIFFAGTAFAQGRDVIGRSLDKLEEEEEVYIDPEADDTQMVIKMVIKYDFELGIEYAIYKYEEPGIDVKLDGGEYSTNFALTGRSKANALFGRLEGRLGYARVDYDGSLSDGTPFTDEGDDRHLEARALAGRDFPLGASILTPYFGMGYRYLNDNLESAYAYEREISYLYSPLGIRTLSPLGMDWEWGVNLEYDIFWSGTVKTHLSDVNPLFNDLKNNQDQGLGTRCSLYLKKKMNDRFSLVIEPFFRYWDIEDSDDSLITVGGTIVGAGREPANTTQEYGLKAGLSW